MFWRFFMIEDLDGLADLGTEMIGRLLELFKGENLEPYSHGINIVEASQQTGIAQSIAIQENQCQARISN